MLRRLLLCLGLCLTSLSLVKGEGILASRCSDVVLDGIVAPLQFSPVPLASSPSWRATLPETMRESYIALGERHLGQPWPTLPASLFADYKTTGTSSGLTNIAKVLKDNLQMGSKIRAIYASNGAKVFEESIKAEIKAARPVFLGGWNSSGKGGHFFLVDGYDPVTNFFHINWGAGGSYDGWFALTALNPGKYNYSSYKKAIIGVQPDYVKGDVNGDGSVSVSDVMMVQQMILKHQYNEAADVNQDGVVDVVDMMAIVQEVMKGGTL